MLYLNLIIQSVFDDIKKIIHKIRLAWLFIASSTNRIKIYNKFVRDKMKDKKNSTRCWLYMEFNKFDVENYYWI